MTDTANTPNTAALIALARYLAAEVISLRAEVIHLRAELEAALDAEEALRRIERALNREISDLLAENARLRVKTDKEPRS